LPSLLAEAASYKLRSQEAGIDLHLIKPVDPAELEDLLKRQIIGA
jgi:hypothetical protein